MSASEAVMVAPEQCATAPKTLDAKHAAPAKTSTTRLVLLAVLALAAATGAMFGVVVLGNQLTQELHPKGSSHLNSVTLVDSEDRAIATTAVESYVSLLDLPLLGTAELNKVDGITFSTTRGIEHRKVTGYTVTTETARVGDSEVQTPRLSLATSAPGETVEVSVRDNKAWLVELGQGSTIVTDIDTASQRRLADGGSCLESGACLYSRDELLRLDAASRRLEEGSFFARADVAAYQVELSGDVMQYLEGAPAKTGTLDGTYSEGGHVFRLRAEESAAGTRVLFTNETSGDSKVITSTGTFVYSADGRLTQCNGHRALEGLSELSIDQIAREIPFDFVDVLHGAPAEGFFPYEPSVKECLDLTAKQANLSTPEALERFPSLAGGAQGDKAMVAEMKKSFWGLGSRRKLAAKATAAIDAAKLALQHKELVDLMMNPMSGRHMTAEELSHPDPKRVLKAAQAKARAHEQRELAVVTTFDLWLATRMADPSAKEAGYAKGVSPAADSYFSAVAPLGADLTMNLAGFYGITVAFAEWTGYYYYYEHAERQRRRQLKIMMAETNIDSMMIAEARIEVSPLTKYRADSSYIIYTETYNGVCVGGFNDASRPAPPTLTASMCMGYSPAELGTDEKSVLIGTSCFPELFELPEAVRPIEDSALAFDQKITAASDNVPIFRRQLSAGGAVMQPSAYASILYKMRFGQKKYVIAFQGTKFDEPAMLAYTISKDPVYYTYGSKSVVTTEGFAMYVAKLFDCIESMSTGLSIYQITGHSLGGAAATLYKIMVSTAGLTTFGAPPTAPVKSVAVKGKINDEGEFESYTYTGIGFNQNKWYKRYFHKFDPVPGYYFNFGNWKHASTLALMLYDDLGCSPGGALRPYKPWGSATPEYGAYPNLPYSMSGIGLGTLYRTLCTEYGVAPNLKKFTGTTAKSYYSYTNAMNPAPCAEVILASTFAYLDSDYGISSSLEPWTPYETYAECTSSYIASVVAYGATYFTSQLIEESGLYDLDSDGYYTPSEGQMTFMIWFYGFWGLWWIHSAYPFYNLSTSSYGDDYYSAPTGNGDPAVAMFDNIISNLPSIEDLVGDVLDSMDSDSSTPTVTVKVKKSPTIKFKPSPKIEMKKEMLMKEQMMMRGGKVPPMMFKK